MSAYPAPTMRALNERTNRQAHAEALAVAARESLRAELANALMRDPTATVQTPGWSAAQKTAPAFEVLNDSFAARSGEAWLIETRRIVALCSQGKADDAQARALALIAAVSGAHADYHYLDLVEGMS